jgi:hypothetical protein
MTDQELIDDVLDNFNFDSVHVAMTVLKWKWSLENGLDVPSKAELRKMARSLMKDAIEKRYEKVSSGGFSAEFYREERKLTLSFVLETYETDPSETFDAENKRS